jgi:hypothetical protein
MAVRLPSSVLEANGTFKHDPNRTRVDPTSPGADIGDAPSSLCLPEIAIWNEIKAGCPWAKTADRFVAEIATRLMYKFRMGECGSGEISQMISAFKALGATPATRSACATAPVKKTEENAFSEFA